MVTFPSPTSPANGSGDQGEMNAAKANTDVTQHVVLLERPGRSPVTHILEYGSEFDMFHIVSQR